MGSGGLVWAVTVIVAAAALAAVLVTVRRSRRRATPAGAAAGPEQPPGARPWVAVVANPTKITDLDRETAWLDRHCAAHGLDAARWWQTTVEDPGCEVTRRALDEKPCAVLAFGGDGTVRAVASALAGTSTPLGILPAGTGNLLARNLSLPLTDLDAAVEIALSGRDRKVDVGQVQFDRSGEDHDPVTDTFCVMAGIGFDAEVMASVGSELKDRVGWWAYILEGTRKLSGPRVRVAIRLDEGEVTHRWVRTVLVGNCGELIGGVPLMPDAELDDGWLDLAVVAPRGVVGWGAVIATVLTRSRRGHPVVQHLRARSVEIRAERPLHVQLDGDPAGTARVLRATADPLALTVRY